MTVQFKPETRARLEAHAAALGLSIDEYLEALVERELPVQGQEAALNQRDSGMVTEESGLRVYRTGKPIPLPLINDAIRRVRDERSRSILGDPR
jgi:hypothetical protein